jgi:hypothetical protein
MTGAQCGNPARWDLRGGPPAMAVPTATIRSATCAPAPWTAVTRSNRADHNRAARHGRRRGPRQRLRHCHFDGAKPLSIDLRSTANVRLRLRVILRRSELPCKSLVCRGHSRRQLRLWRLRRRNDLRLRTLASPRRYRAATAGRTPGFPASHGCGCSGCPRTRRTLIRRKASGRRNTQRTSRIRGLFTDL